MAQVCLGEGRVDFSNFRDFFEFGEGRGRGFGARGTLLGAGGYRGGHQVFMGHLSGIDVDISVLRWIPLATPLPTCSPFPRL